MKEELLTKAAKEGSIGVQNKDGGPFGAVIADASGNIISVGHNMVLESKDPTNHAEIVAIRNACKKLNTSDLSGLKIYSSCEPCPMCLSAIIWSNIEYVYYGATRTDANNAGFRDEKIYDYLAGKCNILNTEEALNKECIDLLKNYNGKLY